MKRPSQFAGAWRMAEVLINFSLIALMLAACENATPFPTSVSTTARATVSPAVTHAAQASFDCPREQIKRLADDFFAAYNQHDLARLLNLVTDSTDAPPGASMTLSSVTNSATTMFRMPSSVFKQQL